MDVKKDATAAQHDELDEAIARLGAVGIFRDHLEIMKWVLGTLGSAPEVVLVDSAPAGTQFLVHRRQAQLPRISPGGHVDETMFTAPSRRTGRVITEAWNRELLSRCGGPKRSGPAR